MAYESLRADDIKTIQKYSDMVYKLAYSMVKDQYDAEDIHQEVFIKYIDKSPNFESEEHEKAWFLRVTINLVKNLWKSAWKQKVTNFFDFENEQKMPQILEPSKEDDIIEVVKTLPQKYRVVIHLFYYEELSIGEIAKVLKMKESTVRTQLTRARQKLREVIKEDLDV